jgi:hypothetical protein
VSKSIVIWLKQPAQWRQQFLPRRLIVVDR